MTTIGEAATELREDIPLNKRINKSGRICNCDEDCLGGSKFINAAFGTLTAVITVALVVQIYYGDYQVVPHGSVATDHFKCSEIGTSILKEGGNAIDAVIASTFCLAVVAPHLTGLDGEGQILIYNHRTRAPPDFISFGGTQILSDSLPRLVLGLAYVHQLYGTISWKDLVEPAARIARNGFMPSKMLVQALAQTHGDLLYGPVELGQPLKLEALADTLQKYANLPEDELYQHITTANQPIHAEGLKSTFHEYVVYVPSSPSIGPYLVINLGHIEKLNFTAADVSSPEYVYYIAKIIQIFTHDLHINDRYHNGTSTNVAAIDLDDNYVSLVTGMYQHFGSGEMTNDGYLLDVKDKQRLCSRIPIIITDSAFICGRRIVLGANDISSATQVIASLLIGHENVTESAEAPRFIMNDAYTIGIEGTHIPPFSDSVLSSLANLSVIPYQISEPYYSVNIIEKFKDDLTSHSDSRGGGIASRF